MKKQYLYVVIGFIFIFITACYGNVGNSENKDLENKLNYKKIPIEKNIEISYIDVYLQQDLFYGGNQDTGLVVVPFVYDETTYLPVRVFARKMNSRDTGWNDEKKELTIRKPNTYPDRATEDYRYKDSFPTHISVSYGGITLFMHGEKVLLDESEQLIIYEKEIYGNADLLCKIFDLKMEWRKKNIKTPSGNYVYKYLFINYDLSKDADIQNEWLESDLIYKRLQ